MFSEKLFYFLCGEQIRKAGMKVGAIRRQSGGMMVTWTSVYTELRSGFLTVYATGPPTVSWVP